MKLTGIKLKVSVKLTFVSYLLTLVILSGIHACIGLLAALIAHETAHGLIALLIHEPIERLELAPFGGVMLYKAGSSPSKGMRGVALALAGPLGNYACMVALGLLPSSLCDIQICRSLATANLSMMLLNLLPVMPLDGGAALFSVGYYIFDVSMLIGVLSALGMMTGVGMCLMAITGAFRYGTLNLSLIVVGLYIFLYAGRNRTQMLIQNAYAVIHECTARAEGIRKVTFFRVTADEQLYMLLPYLCKAKASVFLVESRNGDVAYTDDRTLCCSMLADPGQTIRDVIQKSTENERKLDFTLETFQRLR